jgi:hypothetical protein
MAVAEAAAAIRADGQLAPLPSVTTAFPNLKLCSTITALD